MTFLLSLLILSLVFSVPSYADCSGGKCPMKPGSGHGKQHGGGKNECPIVGKFMKKAHFFLENQKDLALSEEQVQTIKDLKLEVKKATTLHTAQSKIFMLDLEAKMSEPKVDVEGINTMIDTGMAEMATGAKATVASYAKLKAVLTEEQLAKAKELWSAKKS